METGVHGVARPRQWEAVATAEAPGLPGDELDFVVLPDGKLLGEHDVPAPALRPLADALEGSVGPPYRAHAVRRGGDTWAVGANRIQVVQVPEPVDGEEIELSVADGVHTLLVDGQPEFGGVPTLERLSTHESFVVRARRLDGDLWDVRVTPL